MKYIGVDLREIYGTNELGSGIAHVTRELWHALTLLEPAADFTFIPLRRRTDFRQLVDAVLFPTGAVPIWFRGKAFPLVHDLFIFDHPEWFAQGKLKRGFTTQVFLYGLKRAEHLFAVSEYTKKDIIRLAGIAPNKITVSYQGVDLDVPDEEGIQNRDDYFLVLGTIEPRKNLAFLFDFVLHGHLPAHLRIVVAGKKGWGKVAIPNHPQIEYRGEVSLEEKSCLLQQAKALLVPSLAEGFGRTAVEAMRLGTPVVASHTGALPEIIAEGGILLAPNNEEGWVRALTDIENSAEYRHELAQKGISRARAFSWERSLEVILATLKSSC